MMMMVMMMLEGPICENVLQILDMTAPKPEFWMESRPASVARHNRK